MDWKDGLTAAAIVGVGLFGVKTIRERNYRNHLVNKFGVRNAESFSAGDLAEPEWVSRQRDGAESKCFDCGLVREGGQFCPCSNRAESFSAEEPKSKVCRECGDPATHTCEHSYDNDPDGWCKADYCDEDWDTMNEGGSHYWDCNHCDGEGEIPSRWVEDGGDRWNPPSLEVRAWEECEYCDEGKICPEADVPIFEFEAESFAADSISICGVCSVAGHRHCGQTTGCPCCEIRVKKESQRPTCGDCGKLKSSSPQEYSQWTCWPCVESAGGGYHGTECYCSQCMSYENYAESFSADEDMLPVGTLVRSYDFGFPAGDGDKPTVDISCYKEGIIEKIAPSPRCSPNCMHYHIKATKTVWSGKEDKDWLDDFMTHPSPNIRSVAEWDSMNGVEDAEVEFYTRKGGQVYQSTPFGLDEFSAESFSADEEWLARIVQSQYEGVRVKIPISIQEDMDRDFIIELELTNGAKQTIIAEHGDIQRYGAESHAYSYAYNDGHSDARKREEYRPNLSGARQEADFKRIMKQKGD